MLLFLPQKSMTPTLAHRLAARLLSIGAIKLSPQEPYTWASGWRSPIYCDNRLTLSYPELRTLIKQELAALIGRHYPQAGVIAGVATAGIPQGALVADMLNLPFVYVRSKPKGHGLTNMIEGLVSPGKKVVLVEDLISTGGSVIKAAEALRAAGFEVLGLVAIFTYGFDEATRNLAAAHLDWHTLSHYEALLEEARHSGLIGEEEMQTLAAWRQNPADWGR